MKLIARPATFKQYQRHCREKTDAQINHHLLRCSSAMRKAGKPSTATSRSIAPCPPQTMHGTQRSYKTFLLLCQSAFRKWFTKEKYEQFKQLMEQIIYHTKPFLISAKLCFPLD